MAVPSNAAGYDDRDGELLLEHRPFVLRLCRILLRDSPDSEDAAQQVFLRAYRALGKGVRPLNARAWLAEIARNECRSRAARAAARPETPLPRGLAAGEPDPADLAAQHALVARLQQELGDLPARQREAVLLREFRGLSYREVAAAMDETGPAVESLLQRARRRLAERLDGARRPLVGAALAWESVRAAFARLLPPRGAATEVVASGGAAAVAAKLAAAGVAVVGVGAAAGDMPRTAPAPSAPAMGQGLASRDSDSPPTSPTVIRHRFRAVATEPERHGGREGTSGHGRRGGDGSDRDANRGSPGAADMPAGTSGEGSSGSGSGTSGTGSGAETSSSSSGSSGPDNSGSSSDSLSSGPGSGRESSSSSGLSESSGSDASGSGSGSGSEGSSGSDASGSGSGSGSNGSSGDTGSSSSGSGSSGSGSSGSD